MWSLSFFNQSVSKYGKGSLQIYYKAIQTSARIAGKNLTTVADTSDTRKVKSKKGHEFDYLSWEDRCLTEGWSAETEGSQYAREVKSRVQVVKFLDSNFSSYKVAAKEQMTARNYHHSYRQIIITFFSACITVSTTSGNYVEPNTTLFDLLMMSDVCCAFLPCNPLFRIRHVVDFSTINKSVHTNQVVCL